VGFHAATGPYSLYLPTFRHARHLQHHYRSGCRRHRPYCRSARNPCRL